VCWIFFSERNSSSGIMLLIFESALQCDMFPSYLLRAKNIR
jgi:hypothetical protein